MSQINKWKNLQDSDLNGYTLIIPSVAVGNVGQLACDLLISSLTMKKIASVYSLAVVPILGHDPYDLNSSSLSNCCELYQCKLRKIVVLQLRAPLVYKYARKFLDEIVKTFKAKGVKDVIILTSSYAHEKKHILTSPFRYVATEQCPYISQIKNTNWTAHESLDDDVKIFGGGFATMLYKIITENELPCLVLYKYCSEGNNIPDAYEMIEYVTSILPLFSKKMDLESQLVQPVSWKFLFGRPPPQDIY